MVELRILGSPSLVGSDGGEIRSVLQQPKRLALLSYLTLKSNGEGAFTRRDKLLGLFWANSEESRARSSLNQALFQLRRSLGVEAVLTRGDEVAIDPNFLRCDATEFDRAMTSDRGQEAAALYRGPLLDGFFLDGGFEFDQWLEGQRSRYARLAIEAIGLEADRAISSESPAARMWVERAMSVSPSDDLAVRRLMDFESRAGHAAAALDAYQQFLSRLEELGAEPQPETIALAEAIRLGSVSSDPAAPRHDPSGPRIRDDGARDSRPAVETSGLRLTRAQFVFVALVLGGTLALGGVLASIAFRLPEPLPVIGVLSLSPTQIEARPELRGVMDDVIDALVPNRQVETVPLPTSTEAELRQMMVALGEVTGPDFVLGLIVHSEAERTVLVLRVSSFRTGRILASSRTLWNDLALEESHRRVRQLVDDLVAATLSRASVGGAV